MANGLSTGADEAGGVVDRLGLGHVVAEPRQVGDDEAVGLGPSDRGRVVHHVLHGDLQGVFVAEHHHRQRVADENEVGAGFADHARGGRVVRGQHDQRVITVALLGRGDLGRRECLVRHRTVLLRQILCGFASVLARDAARPGRNVPIEGYVSPMPMSLMRFNLIDRITELNR